MALVLKTPSMDKEFETPKSKGEESVQPFLIDFAANREADYDVDFRCQRLSVRAHKLVVTSRSKVLAKMLESQMVEGGAKWIVKIEDMDPGALRLFVRGLYTGRLAEAPTFESAVALYKAAFKYKVEDLAFECTEFLVEGLTVQNAWDILRLAESHLHAKLMEEALFFILENGVPWDSKEWQDFCNNHFSLVDKVMNRYLEEADDASEYPEREANGTLEYPEKMHCV